jgi:superfamily I DNA/RNA helicase
VITQKIAHLIEDKGFEPRHIAAVTFTNKAAKEMQERIGKLMEGKTTREGSGFRSSSSRFARSTRSACRSCAWKPSMWA